MLKCNKCGKEYSYGRKIHHACNENLVNQGVIFESSKRNHNWNCVPTESAICKIQERIIASYVSNSKVNSLLVYE